MGAEDRYVRQGRSDIVRCPQCETLLVTHTGILSCGNCGFEDDIPDEWLPKHVRGGQINHQHWEAEAERLEAEREANQRLEFLDPT